MARVAAPGGVTAGMTESRGEALGASGSVGRGKHALRRLIGRAGLLCGEESCAVSVRSRSIAAMGSTVDGGCRLEELLDDAHSPMDSPSATCSGYVVSFSFV